MTVVSYDSGKMNSAIRAYKNALKDVQHIRETMTNEVNKIKENWKGNDRENAEKDLKAIVEQMANIDENLTEIINMFAEVDSNFNELSY